jgi:hypothetical protein
VHKVIGQEDSDVEGESAGFQAPTIISMDVKERSAIRRMEREFDLCRAVDSLGCLVSHSFLALYKEYPQKVISSKKQVNVDEVFACSSLKQFQSMTFHASHANQGQS